MNLIHIKPHFKKSINTILAYMKNKTNLPKRNDIQIDKSLSLMLCLHPYSPHPLPIHTTKSCRISFHLLTEI